LPGGNTDDGNSDEQAPAEEQIRQILSIAPIVDGSERNSKYDIPPHHKQANAPHANEEKQEVVMACEI
jgi:hypothetical protein